MRSRIYPDAMRQQQIQYIPYNFEYEVMLQTVDEEVYMVVVGDPLKAMPSTLKKRKYGTAQTDVGEERPRKRLTAFPGAFSFFHSTGR